MSLGLVNAAGGVIGLILITLLGNSGQVLEHSSIVNALVIFLIGVVLFMLGVYQAVKIILLRTEQGTKQPQPFHRAAD